MTQSLIPRRGVYISSGILFHPDMSGPVAYTLMQLIALCSSNRARMTAPLSFHTLSGLTRKSVRTLYGHFSVLQNNYAALRLQTAEGGIFMAASAGRLARLAGPLCKFLQMPIKKKKNLIFLNHGLYFFFFLLVFLRKGGLGGNPAGLQKFSKPPPESFRFVFLQNNSNEYLALGGLSHPKISPKFSKNCLLT